MRRTIDAVRQLVTAHVVLARAEAAVILADAKQVAIRLGLGLALIVYIAILVPVGTALFLGEWIFGSMGWGILHGALFSAASAFVLVLGALHIRRTYLAGRFLVAVLIGIVVGTILGLAMPHAAYVAIGDSAASGVDAGVRPLLIGMAIWGAIGALLGLLLGARFGGLGGALGGFFVGAVAGALFGAFTAISFSPQVGAAIGVTVALIAWPLLSGMSLRGYDWEDLRRRFVPQASIDAATESMDYVKARMPGRGEDAP